LPITHYQLLITDNQLLITHYSLLILIMARKAIHKSVKDHARSLYLTGEFTLEYIGEILNVTASTIGKWRDTEGWDKSLSYEQSITENFLELLSYHSQNLVMTKRLAQENNEPYSLPKGSDITPYLNFVKRKELAFEEVVRYMSGFMEYLATTDLSLANAAKIHATAYIMKQEKLLRK
jgi:hypothetical protein